MMVMSLLPVTTWMMKLLEVPYKGEFLIFKADILLGIYRDAFLIKNAFIVSLQSETESIAIRWFLYTELYFQVNGHTYDGILLDGVFRYLEKERIEVKNGKVSASFQQDDNVTMLQVSRELVSCTLKVRDNGIRSTVLSIPKNGRVTFADEISTPEPIMVKPIVTKSGLYDWERFV